MKHFSKKEIPDLPFKEAVKKGIPIRCCQIYQPFVVKTMEGILVGQPGDYLMVGVKNELYPCSQEVFNKSYTFIDQDEKLYFDNLETVQLPFRLAVKRPLPIRFYQMNESFKVTTLEGNQEGKAGDYLMVGIMGELYPCDKTIFEQTYEVI